MKKTRSKNKSTIDKLHDERVSIIEKRNDELPIKKRRLEEIEREIEERCFNNGDLIYLHKEKEKLELEIRQIQNSTFTMSYIADTFDYLLEHFDNNENVNKNTKPIVQSNKNVIVLEIDPMTGVEKPPVSNRPIINMLNSIAYKNRVSGINNDEYTIVSKEDENEDNYKRYTEVLGIRRRRKKEILRCKLIIDDKYCDGEIILDDTGESYICNKCYVVRYNVTISDKNGNGDIVQEPVNVYKRNNHLKEIISQVQANEHTTISDELFVKIKNEMDKRGWVEEDLDAEKLKMILKRLKERKYYEHIPHILQKISGKIPPKFTVEQEYRFLEMFSLIQEPFEKHKPPNRKNLFIYSYIMNHFCKIEGLYEFLVYFPLLKNPTKLRQYDKTMEKVFAEVGLPFYKSF